MLCLVGLAIFYPMILDRIKSIPWQKVLPYVILALLIYVPVFGFIDILPIRMWDEARTSVNALEMYMDHDYIVTHYTRQVENWNTKPPLLLWFQVFWMKVLGPGELAIRLPSSIAVFLICMAFLYIAVRYLKQFWFGFIAVVLLITSEGFMNIHIARTGDYDALLTFFVTISSLCFFAFSETKKNKYLYFCFTALTAAVLTKGVAGLLILPAFGIYALIRRQWGLFLSNKHFYFGLLEFIVLVGGYYLLREYKNPGYLTTVQTNELGGRFLSSQGNQGYPFWYYYINLITYRLADRYLLIPCGLLLGLFSKNEKIRRLALFVMVAIVSFFLLISKSETKMYWYDAPLYPFMALAIAFVVHYFFDLLQNLNYAKEHAVKNVLPFVFLFLIFITPYHVTFSRTFYPNEEPWDTGTYEIGYYLKNAIRGKIDMNNKSLLYDGYNAQNLFYIYILNLKGVKTGVRFPSEHLKRGEMLVVCQDNMKQMIKDNYLYKIIKKQDQVETYEILGE